MNFENIKLVPRQLSYIKSRNDVILSIPFGNINLSMPILHSPMDTIGSIEMAKLFRQNNLLGCLPRKSFFKNSNLGAIVSIGLSESELYNLKHTSPIFGNYYFLIDVANGFNSNIEAIINKIKYKYENVFIIAGNVASAEGYKYLASLDVDAIRVGIGIGSHCLTTINTGIGQSLIDSVIECYKASLEIQDSPLIIADGGMSTVGEIVKALAVGADLVMLGSMFAGTTETPGNIILHNKEKYKIYRGSASYASQLNFKENPYYIEGEETLVKYKGSAQKVLDKIDAGLRSAFSYLGANNMSDFRIISKESIKYV